MVKREKYEGEKRDGAGGRLAASGSDMLLPLFGLLLPITFW